MKILLNQTSLCDGGVDSVTEFTIDGEDITQPIGGLRIAFRRPAGRGNTLHSLRFSLEREHADTQTAQSYLLTHHAGLPKAGSLAITCQSLVGAESDTVIAAKNAALKKSSGRFLGCRTFHTYELECDELAVEEGES